MSRLNIPFLSEVPDEWASNEFIVSYLKEIARRAKFKVKHGRGGVPSRMDIMKLAEVVTGLFSDIGEAFRKKILQAVGGKSLPTKPPSPKSSKKDKAAWNKMLAVLTANIGPPSKCLKGSSKFGGKLRMLAMDIGFLSATMEDALGYNDGTNYGPTQKRLKRVWGKHGVKVQGYINELTFIFKGDSDTDTSDRALLKAVTGLFKACNKIPKGVLS